MGENIDFSSVSTRDALMLLADVDEAFHAIDFLQYRAMENEEYADAVKYTRLSATFHTISILLKKEIEKRKQIENIKL